MKNLTRDLLASGILRVDHAPGAPVYPINVLQIGDGNFLRGFVDWMIDIANGLGLFKGGVAIAKPRPHGHVVPLDAQDGLYTVLLRGIEDGREVTTSRLVSCVQTAFNPHERWETLLRMATDPVLRFVVSNTTEAGIVDADETYLPGTCPVNFPAKVTALLYERYRVLGNGAASGLIFLPCELIEGNGTQLKRFVLSFAQRWKLDAAFQRWVEQDNHFLDTLVDRIVTGYPAAEASELCAQWGYNDPLIVAAEPFHIWVIQGPPTLAEEFPLHKAGLNVIWTDDLQPYRAGKVRVLNGAHTATALAAYGSGLDTVLALTRDATLSAFLHKVMFDEIVPFVPLPEAERQRYATTILERFANPYIRHELIAIALNSVSKWTVRVLPTIKDYADRHGRAPTALSFSLAALLWFYRGTVVGNDYIGRRAAGAYPIKDAPSVIAIMAAAWTQNPPGTDRSAAIVDGLLGDIRLWGEDLRQVPDLARRVTEALVAIESQDMKVALEDLLRHMGT